MQGPTGFEGPQGSSSNTGATGPVEHASSPITAHLSNGPQQLLETIYQYLLLIIKLEV